VLFTLRDCDFNIYRCNVSHGCLVLTLNRINRKLADNLTVENSGSPSFPVLNCAASEPAQRVGVRESITVLQCHITGSRRAVAASGCGSVNVE
jgi:hypothetical protein